MDQLPRFVILRGSNTTSNSSSANSTHETTNATSNSTTHNRSWSNESFVFAGSAIQPFWNFISEETLIYYRSVILIMISALGILNFKLVYSKNLHYCVSFQNTSYITNFLGIFFLWLASITKNTFLEQLGSAMYQLALSTTTSLIITVYLFYFQQSY